MIKVIDRETKELLLEIPPEKALDAIAKMWELAGIFVDERR
jgi:flagellar protein FlaG